MPRLRLASSAGRYCLSALLALSPACAGSAEDHTSRSAVSLPASIVEVGSPQQPGSPPSVYQPREPRADSGETAAVALPPRSSPTRRDDAPDRQRSQSTGHSTIATVLGSLGLVIGLFLLVAWVFRRSTPQSSLALSNEVVQVLGRAPLANRNMMQLVRIGNKLLLVSVTPQGATTLTEITDRLEVDRLTAVCERQRPASITASFRQVLGQFAQEPATPGFLGNERLAELAAARQGRDD